MTRVVQVRWARTHNPTNLASGVAHWVFPSRLTRASSKDLERDIRGHHLLKAKRPLNIVVHREGITTLLPFKLAYTLGRVNAYVLTTRAFVSPSGSLCNYKYTYSSGQPIRAGDVVTLGDDGANLYKVVKGKGHDKTDPRIKLRALYGKKHIVARTSQLVRAVRLFEE